MRFLLFVTCGLLAAGAAVQAQDRPPVLPPGFTYGTKPKPQDEQASAKESKSKDAKAASSKAAPQKAPQKTAPSKGSAERQSLSKPSQPAYRKSTTGPGIEVGGGFRTCAPDETSPAGTVDRGYRKVIAKTAFGDSCSWEPVETSHRSEATAGDTAQPSGPAPGIDVGGGYRSCAPGEGSPSGTIKNGYRKVESATPWGKSCRWEPVARVAAAPEKN